MGPDTHVHILGKDMLADSGKYFLLHREKAILSYSIQFYAPLCTLHNWTHGK